MRVKKIQSFQGYCGSCTKLRKLEKNLSWLFSLGSVPVSVPDEVMGRGNEHSRNFKLSWALPCSLGNLALKNALIIDAVKSAQRDGWAPSPPATTNRRGWKKKTRKLDFCVFCDKIVFSALEKEPLANECRWWVGWGKRRRQFRIKEKRHHRQQDQRDRKRKGKRKKTWFEIFPQTMLQKRKPGKKDILRCPELWLSLLVRTRPSLYLSIDERSTSNFMISVEFEYKQTEVHNWSGVHRISLWWNASPNMAAGFVSKFFISCPHSLLDFTNWLWMCSNDLFSFFAAVFHLFLSSEMLQSSFYSSLYATWLCFLILLVYIIL